MKKLYRKGTVHPTPPLVSDHLSFLPVAILTLAAALSQEDKEVLAYLISCSTGSGNFSGDFSNNRRNTHKLKTPNSASDAVSGAKNGSSAVSGGVGGGGGAERVLSGEFSGNRRNTHKLKTPNSATETSFGGGTKGGAAVSGGVGGAADHPASFNCDCFSCYMSYWVKWDLSPNRQLIHEILDAYEEGLQSKKEKSKKERRNKNKGSNISSGSVELKKTSSESNLNINGSVPGGSGEPDPVEETSGNHGGGDEDECGGEEGGEKGSVRKFVSFIGEKIWSVWT
ncbi:PREDICTED: uncharacterized protein LOC109237894 [Nicotiana attenuata]|uniref:Uncharacterized protein n=1 Tax=Nicotiana attenuata TaxID=49451 RepID=A0A314LD05_NICAT|nr:PREDICTED: uncharacterized protein LOC109237894 [Nicotiana attenuata]OIT39581.1 hypothetical protein A4A49_28149 [Nicotiana attenuata]